MAIYEYQNCEPRWFSFENPKAQKGQGAKENSGAKGHAFEYFADGEKKTLVDYAGEGVIRRVWMTFEGLAPEREKAGEILRGVTLQIFWDGEEKSSVEAPLGDFFLLGTGEMRAYENVFFASPEGRSLVCYVPMPFRKRVKIQLENQTGTDIKRFFYDVDMTLEPVGEAMYFCTSYREVRNRLCEELIVLQREGSKGRFLGMNVAAVFSPDYEGYWFGESEVKVYLDGDREYPTLAGTGVEDYIGTAWGQGEFCGRYQGCLAFTPEQTSFYRFHVRDPIFYGQDCRVAMQTIGGAPKQEVMRFLREGKEICPVSADIEGRLLPLYQKETIEWEQIPDDTWVNCWRCDTYRLLAYYYEER
ncbi:MAG: DUF2961 domain-containing protein [Eubacteriales bacterium]|nr:DUF2961 domain-containing protein [Eubacteriales bacterium]